MECAYGSTGYTFSYRRYILKVMDVNDCVLWNL